LAMSFLLSQLEKDKIDKIIMFINDTPVRGSVAHGFLPGTLTEKLCESQVGNFLMGKLGSKEQILHLISMGKLLLLPISDIRGFDTSTMKAGIYITEAQNMSVDMMKLALQRIGDDCICIIDGDCNTQVDSKMFEGKSNGMRRLSEIFRGKDIYGEMELNTTYRSRIAEIAESM
jgi:PhoH-like ATPase